MTGSRSTLTLSCLPVLVCLLASAPEAAADVWLDGDADEQAAMRHVEAERYVLARKRIDEILSKGPSFLATYALSRIYHEAEGNLPRALFLVRKAMAMLLERYGSPPEKQKALQHLAQLLRDEISILGEMDRREEQLARLDAYGELFGDGLEARKIWPLFKLGRFDEARALGERLVVSDDPLTRMVAANSMMALADEQGDRKGTYEWGRRALAVTHGDSCTVASNVAEGAFEIFRHDEVEGHVKTARKADRQDCAVSPLTHLVQLFLGRGDLRRALDSLLEVRTEQLERRLMVQQETGQRAMVIELLLAVGRLDEVEERLPVLVSEPDRVGFSSISSERSQLGNLLLYFAALSAAAERAREQRAVRSFFVAVAGARERVARSLALWRARRRAMRLLSLQELLISSVRPYLSEIQPWYMGVLVDLLGPGVVAQAAAEGRELEAEVIERARGYYDALEGEAAWRRGDLAAARRFGASAVETLPAAEGLLRWRVRAWLGAALVESGEAEAATPHLREVLRRYPGVLRQLRIALPVRVEHDSSAGARAVAELLEESPRFEAGGGVFKVSVSTMGEGLRLCLSGPGGESYACSERGGSGEPAGAPEDDADEDEQRARAVDRFADTVFSTAFDLPEATLMRLDRKRMSLPVGGEDEGGEATP